MTRYQVYIPRTYRKYLGVDGRFTAMRMRLGMGTNEKPSAVQEEATVLAPNELFISVGLFCLRPIANEPAALK